MVKTMPAGGDMGMARRNANMGRVENSPPVHQAANWLTGRII